jgi:hypothetical protein
VCGLIFKRSELERRLVEMGRGKWFDDFIHNGKVTDTVKKVLDELVFNGDKKGRFYRSGGYKSVFAGTDTSTCIKQQVRVLRLNFRKSLTTEAINSWRFVS